VLAITGAIAVLIIVIAGFRYIVSQGNPNEVTTSRNAIIYSLVGLIVIIAAYAIVNFVVLGVG
jgi:multisubunit Na+/H+ antiporter MnhB subunit